MERFLSISERVVSSLDEYGDENWKGLDREIDRCIEKLAQAEGGSVHSVGIEPGLPTRTSKSVTWPRMARAIVMVMPSTENSLTSSTRIFAPSMHPKQELHVL